MTTHNIAESDLSDIRASLNRLLTAADADVAAAAEALNRATTERNRLAGALRALDPEAAVPGNGLWMRLIQGRGTGPSLKQRVFDWCAASAGPANVAALHEAGLGNKQSLANALNDLHSAGRLRRVAHGQYEVAA